MSRLQFIAYDGADILAMTPGTLPAPLGELTDAREKHVYAELYGTGSGDFVIDRDSAQAPWVVYGNWVGVKRTWETDPFFLFQIEERDDVFVSKEEEGGEYLHRGGRGQIVVLDWARLLHYYSGAGTDPINAAEGWWEFAAAATPGSVMRTAILDAQARTPAAIPFVTMSFDATNDSNSDAWVAPAGEPQAPIGATLLELLDAQVEREIEAQMSPTFELGLYSLYQRDLTNSVVFRKGFNIRESASVDGQYGIGSRAIVRGSNDAGEPTYTEVTDGQTATLEGAGSVVGRRELFVEHGSFKTTADLTAAGQQALKSSRAKTDGEFTLGVTHGPAGGDGGTPAALHMEPFTDYRVGDLITLDIPGVYDNSSHRISGIHLDETSGEDEDPDLADPDGLIGGYEVVIELDGQPYRSSGFDPNDRGGGDAGNVFADQDAELELCTPTIVSSDHWGIEVIDGEVQAPVPTAGEYHVWVLPSTDHGNCEGSVGPNIWSGNSIFHQVLTIQLADECVDLVHARLQIKLRDDVFGGSQGGRGPFSLRGGMAGETPVEADLNGELLASGIYAVIGDDGSTLLATVTIPLRALNFAGTGWTRFVLSPEWEMGGAQCCSGDGNASCAGSGDYAWGVGSLGSPTLTFYKLVSGTYGWITTNPLGTQDGSNTSFSLIGGYDMVESVMLNGIVQPAGSWEATDGTTLETIGWAPEVSDNVSVRYRIPVPV